MADGATAGVVNIADVNAMTVTSASGSDSAAFWSHVWFGVAVAFLLCLFFGLGGFRGSVSV